MIKLYISLIILALFCIGCSDKPASNVVTKYAENLRDDVKKAEIAAEKANKAIAATQDALNDFKDVTD